MGPQSRQRARLSLQSSESALLPPHPQASVAPLVPRGETHLQGKRRWEPMQTKGQKQVEWYRMAKNDNNKRIYINLKTALHSVAHYYLLRQENMFRIQKSRPDFS
jgi:hypothetical protein